MIGCVAATKLEMKINEIPDRWHASLDNYIAQHSSPPDFDIGSVPFDDNVSLRFLDGSTAHFFRAFVLRDPTYDELAVFTEHCLHHIFPLAGTEVRITKNDSG